jgi:hypothetical protein
MTVERALRLMAGTMVLVSLALARHVSPYGKEKKESLGRSAG